MWPCPSLDLSVQRNAILPIGFQLTDNTDSQPIGLSGISVTCRVRFAAGSASVLASPAVTVTDSGAGKFDILFDGRDLSAVAGTQETVALYYEVLATDARGPMPILRGHLYLQP